MVTGVDFTAYATDTDPDPNYMPEYAFDTTLANTGPSSGSAWRSDYNLYNQRYESSRLIIVFANPIEFDTIEVVNYHDNNLVTKSGMMEVEIFATTDEYTDTTFLAPVTNGVSLGYTLWDQFDIGTPIQTVWQEGVDITPPVNTITTKSIIFDIADGWGDPQYLGLRSIEFSYNGVVIPLEILRGGYKGYGTSVWSGFDYRDEIYSTNFIRVGHGNRAWYANTSSITNQRLIIVFDVPIEFDEILINNFTTGSSSELDRGVRNMRVWCSDQEYTDVTYSAGALPSHGTMLSDFFELRKHVVENIYDPISVWSAN